MQLDLLGCPDERMEEIVYDASLSQWMTPAWVAEEVTAHALPDLAPGDTVIEPSCGVGRFLNALPAGVNAIGVEVDPRLANIAQRGGRATIVKGDFRTVELPVERCDAIIGNPPFQMEVLDGMLERCHELLDEGGPVVFILPAFAFQTSSRVVRYNRRWTISQEMLPRTLFPGIRLPLLLARFVKDRHPKLVGMLLYHQSREIEEMPQIYRRALVEGASGWKAVVEEALRRLGGEGSVSQVCEEIAPRRPTDTIHWRAKVRQQLGLHFKRKGPALYALAA